MSYTSKKGRVLLADTDTMFIKGLRSHLESAGYEVVYECSNGNDALKKAAIADKLKSTPRPGVGSDGGTVMTLKKLRTLSDEEYEKFATEHPEEYKALYEEGEK